MSSRKMLFPLLILLFLLGIVFLAILNIPNVYEPPFLLAFLNTVFLGIIPIGIAVIAARVFLRRGSISVLLLGTGILLFGLGSVAAGWVNPLPGGPNMTVTLHNICACAGSFLIFTGSLAGFGSFAPADERNRRMLLSALFGAAMLFFIVLAGCLFAGYVPDFYIPGSGFTPLRQIVLENATLFFALSSLVFFVAYRENKSEFIAWSAVAFALISTGLLAVFFQPSVGSLIGWAGRAGQYLGCTIALYAVVLAWKTALAGKIPLEEVIAQITLSRKKRGDLSARILDTVAEGILLSRPSDKVILYANPRFEAMFGYGPGELRGKNVALLHATTGTAQPAQAATEMLRILSERGEWSGELCNVKKDGSCFWSHVSITSFDHEIFGTVWISTQTDITAQKKTEQALRESEERFRSIVENANDLINLVSPDGMIVYISPNVRSLLGYEPDELVGKRAELYVHPDDLPRIRAQFQQVMGTGASISGREIRIRHKDGSWRVLSQNIAAIRDSGGAVLYGVGSSHDITDQKRAEILLQESEERFRSIVENANVLINLISPTGFFTYMSPNVREILGYEPGEIIGTHVNTLIHPDDIPLVRDIVRSVMEEGTAHAGMEFRVRHRNGSWRLLTQNIAAVRNHAGTVVNGVGIARDVTDHRQAIDALHESEARYRAIFTAETDAIFVVDVETATILDYNDAVLQMYGYRDHELAGQSILTISAEPERTREFIGNHRGREQHSIPFRLHKRKDGTTFPVEIMTDALNLQGRTVIVGAVRDISERRRTEATLRNANLQLKLLTSIMRHDISNKMLALSASIDMAGEMLKEPEKSREHLETAKKISRDISGFIRFTREYQDLGSRDAGWVDLESLLPVGSIPEGIRFLSAVSGYEIFADPLVEKAFFNLLDNAIRHGERVTRIRVSAYTHEGTLTIVWEDNGIGIPDEDKENIFERGFGKNTGFGLFLVREILALTGMTICETGLEGRGARFVITVPPGNWGDRTSH